MTIAGNPIDKLITDIELNVKADPSLNKTLQLELEKLVRRMYSDAIGQTNGYCMILKIAETDVFSIVMKCKLNLKDIQEAFITQWQVPRNAYMISNPFYHSLLLFALYGVRHRNDSISKNAMVLLLAKLWNGRRSKYIKWCDPDVMRYVVANLSGKYLPRKYDSPMTLVMNYFATSLLETYGERMNADSGVTKRLFDQSWGRIRQIFVSDMAPDLKTGERKARGGLSPLYYDAKEKGLKITKPHVTNDLDKDDVESSSIEHYSTSDYDEIISNVANFIVMNIHSKYDQNFVNFVNQESKVNVAGINLILSSIHNINYTDHIRDILELMLKQLQLINRNDICPHSFIAEVVKKKIVSSKHTPTIVQLKNIVDDLLELIFRDKIPYINYSNYSTPKRGQLRKVIIYGIAYNLQSYICSG